MEKIREASTDIDTKNCLKSVTARNLFLESTSQLNDGVDGDYQDFLNILEIVLNPANQPVLVHCHGGKHRTGMIAMAVRYIQGDMSPEQIEAEYRRYARIRLNAPMGPRKKNIEFIRWFVQTPEFAQLRQRYGQYL